MLSSPHATSLFCMSAALVNVAYWLTFRRRGLSYDSRPTKTSLRFAEPTAQKHRTENFLLSRPFHPLHPDHSRQLHHTNLNLQAHPAFSMPLSIEAIVGLLCMFVGLPPAILTIRKLCQRRSLKAQQVEGSPTIASTRRAPRANNS